MFDVGRFVPSSQSSGTCFIFYFFIDKDIWLKEHLINRTMQTCGNVHRNPYKTCDTLTNDDMSGGKTFGFAADVCRVKTGIKSNMTRLIKFIATMLHARLSSTVAAGELRMRSFPPHHWVPTPRRQPLSPCRPRWVAGRMQAYGALWAQWTAIC